MAFTLTLQDTLNWSTYFIGNRASAFAPNNQPALTTANLVQQIILQPPFKWRWNRSEASFLLANPVGWQPAQTVTTGYRIVDSNGHLQTVTVSGTTGAVEPTWAFSINGTTADGTVTWLTTNVNDYVQNIPNFGMMEKAYLLVNPGAGITDAGTVYEIPNRDTELSLDFGEGRPDHIAPQGENAGGGMLFRFTPGQPDKFYTCNVSYQKKAPLFAALSDPWSIPDDYAFVYNWGFLAFMYLYADSAKFSAANGKFVSALLGVSEGLTEQQVAVFLEQYDFFIQNALRFQSKTQQGFQARGV